MADELGSVDVGGFAEALKRFLDAVNELAPEREPEFVRRLREHLSRGPDALPVVGESFPVWEQANLQLALDAWLEGTPAELVGVAVSHAQASLLQMVNSGWTRPGPVAFEEVALGDGRVITCIRQGAVLTAHADSPVAVLLCIVDQGMRSMLMVEVLSLERERSQAVLAELRRLMLERNVYRGRVVSMAPDMHGGIRVSFHHVPPVTREDIVLPDGVLGRLERHTAAFAKHADVLRAAGRHLKRGALLHGPPGNGKTLAIRYTIGTLPGRTTIVLKGSGFGVLPDAFRMARELAPSTIVMEDVDLVAEERTHMHGGGAILFELLNHMDGLDDDVDVILLLTTNRPDLLEPALAQRPGRVDLALEIPLPDAEGRRRLLELYGRGLRLELRDPGVVVEATEGASGAFFRELMRRAALIAATRNGGVVTDVEVAEALDELTSAGDILSRAIFGGRD